MHARQAIYPLHYDFCPSMLVLNSACHAVPFILPNFSKCFSVRIALLFHFVVVLLLVGGLWLYLDAVTLALTTSTSVLRSCTQQCLGVNAVLRLKLAIPPVYHGLRLFELSSGVFLAGIEVKKH